MKDQIVQYAARGFDSVKISEIVGCSESYVSQVRAELAVDIELAQKRLKRSEAEEKLEDEYVKLEESVLAQAKENLPFAEFRDLTMMMNALIARKQKLPSSLSIVHNTQNNNYTVLQVPARRVQPEITFNQNKEMIAVDGKSLAPMPSEGVKSLFKRIEEKKVVEKIEKAINMNTLESLPEDF